ncbi:unnamed protein product [Brassica rapa]|uniref:Uncharacterized protein n=1 Tax=Brassica campestris TaxID=3711 RepID=A0A8D9GWA2_BRACM|nr:unnamed protein product [Brassica rapa]
MLPFVLETIPVKNPSKVISIFRWVLCFVAKKGTETELKRRLHVVFPRWSLATIYVMLVFLTAYVSAAMEQLFLFHLVLIRKYSVLNRISRPSRKI